MEIIYFGIFRRYVQYLELKSTRKGLVQHENLALFEEFEVLAGRSDVRTYGPFL
jgi:hypothetical protein